MLHFDAADSELFYNYHHDNKHPHQLQVHLKLEDPPASMLGVCNRERMRVR